MSSFLRCRWWIILALAVCLGLYRLRLDVNILGLLPSEEPTVQGLQLYEKHFTNARELIVTVRAPESEVAERLVESLATRLRQNQGLVESVTWQPPWMEKPDQIGELMGWLWLNQPPHDFAALARRLAPDQLQPVLDETKERLATSMSPAEVARRAFDPFNLLSFPALNDFGGMPAGSGQQMFTSGDGKFRVLYVQSAVDLGSYVACANWLNSIRAAVDELKTGPTKEEWNEVVVRMTGRPVFVEEIATSMQRDMRQSLLGTAAIIALLFWLMHRRLLPMLWLLTLLGLVLFVTLALGGLVLGTVNVVSLGFAAVLLGLAVDYAVVHYQEALSHPQMTVPEIRRTIAPSILWAAVTTMSAFLVLNLSGLPGMGQLGTLVGIGVGVAALVMVLIYLPPLFPDRRQSRCQDQQPAFRWWDYFCAPCEPLPAEADAAGKFSVRGPMLLTGLIVAGACAVLCFQRPTLDRSGDALRPQHGAAEMALDEMTSEFGMSKQPFWVVVSGQNEAAVYQHLAAAKMLLRDAADQQVVGKFLLPDVIWPRVEFQAANRATAALLSKQGPLLQAKALENGFNADALVLTEGMIRTWTRANEGAPDVWPTNSVSQWLIKRMAARTPEKCLAIGMVYPAATVSDPQALSNLSARLAEEGAYLSSWELLGSATLKRVQARMWLIVTPMLLLILLSLWFAFRRATEILLGLAVLGLAGLTLVATMALAGWSWNLMNLMALPLVLGTGVDYTIFIQLALRRHGGDENAVRRSVGRALFLCGGTAVAGFGSLAFSSNLGMASLGKLCAVGIGANTLISIFLLPTWWRLSRRGNTGAGANKKAPTFYRADFWRFGLFAARVIPAGILRRVARFVAQLYGLTHRQACTVVVQNFLPLFAGDRRAAESAARSAFRNFGAKIVDLWRVEGGDTHCQWLVTPAELQIIQAARQRGNGILFITLHLGNWEHGGLLLNELGIRLTILTQAEPDDCLTALRKAARVSYQVDTLIIGEDVFTFVDAIKQLQAGGNLALSLDRPPDRGGTPVEFFGQRFEASLAAADLARASGCALIGVTIVRRPGGYAVRVLPEFVYERNTLRDREARIALTQQILRAFEPEIRKDIDQWYQFSPIWPKDP